MAGRAIEPLNAPLPTARNLPFQFSSGSHSSILMSESVDGVSVAATRHSAGKAGEAAEPLAAIGCAAVSVTLTRASAVSRSHATAAAKTVLNIGRLSHRL